MASGSERPLWVKIALWAALAVACALFVREAGVLFGSGRIFR